MKVYLDSSAFAKRFVDETGSDLVEAVCAQADTLAVSVICVPEIVSALNRRRRERGLTARQYREAKRRLLDDVADTDIIQLTPAVLGTAVRILEASPIRAMDALHVACALEWGADRFITADKRQSAAAKRQRLTVQIV